MKIDTKIDAKIDNPPSKTLDTARPDSATIGDGPRVLVIDNDVPTADAITNLLEMAGYTVDVATDAQYGLMLVESFAPRVVVLSTSLRGMSAHDMTQILRSAPQYAAQFRGMHLIYLADNRAMIQQRFHDLPEIPMSSYIFKPLNPAELLEKIERALQ